MAQGRKPKYTPERVETICRAIANGDSYSLACKKAQISEDTFANWRKWYSEFSEAVKKAEAEYNKWYSEELVRDCKKSLKNLILGMDYEETTTEYERDKFGNPQIKKQKTVTKHIAPSPTAIIFALTNRDPENWKNRQSNEITGNLKTESETKVDLSAVPDELLEQVLAKINGGE